MPESTAHPSEEQLNAYNLGQLPPDEAVAIESHISKCEPCCDTIISLSSDDTFVGLLKEARQLPTDQTVDQGVAATFSSCQDVPIPLAEHPRYEILGLIGKGGMGDVYKARHRKMERTVALKVINRGLVRKAEAVARFHREVKAAAQLTHPNIVTSHDADQAGDFHFMVMEYVDGVDLSQTVKDRGALPVAEACDYIRQAAIGLQHAHECGMVHRDIKPHNLMITSDGTLKILDFGLASLAPEAIADAGAVEARGDLTAAGAIMGTPDFISPEQADDARKADIRSDIYSLGATLYFLLAGRPPFAEGSLTQKLKSHAQVEPEPLESLRKDIPPELTAIVAKMTAKDADERYFTPSEVADALESFLRTWRPDEAALQGQEASSGGDMSGSDGQKPATGDGGRDWLSVAVEWLFPLSFVPIGFLMWELFFTDFTSDAADIRFWFYITATLCLSIIAGALSAAQRYKSVMRQFERGDRRAFRLKPSETLIIAGILIGALFAFVHYVQTNHGVVRVEVNDPSLEVSINDHTITMKDGDGKELTIRPGKQTLTVRKDDADFEFETDRFQIRRGDEIAFKVEMLQGEIVVRKDGERFNSQALPDDVRVQQILGRMVKAYAECDSYRDSGVMKTVIVENAGSPQITFEHLFTTVFQRPDRFRLEIKDEDEDRLLIFANGQDVRSWWDVEPGIQKPESLEIAMAQAIGFAGGDVGRIPALLMPEKLEGWGDLDLIDPKQLEVGQLQDKECFRLEYNFRDEQITLWIDKQSYLVRRIDEQITTDGLGIERTTTYDPTIDSKITGVMLEFSLPAPRADDRANMLPSTVDLTQLQGDWNVIAFTQDGRNEFAADKGVCMLVQIKGDTITRIQTGPTGEKSEKVWGRIELDSKTTPKSIDIVNPDGPSGRLLGIYEVKDGALKICFAEQSNTDVAEGRSVKRPTTFAAPAGSRNVLVECQRVDEDPDLKQLQGEWELLTVQEGERRKSVPPDNALVTVQGNSLRSHNGNRRIEIDSNKDPKTIDFYDEKGGLRLRGIYKFNDDRLIMILHEDDKLKVENPPYPKSFDPPADNDTILWELRKAPRDEDPSTNRTILDQGYTILDGGKEIGSRRLIVTEDDQALSIVEETSLALKFEGAPLGIVELDVSAVYSITGDTPRLVRATTSAKEQGALLMHGTVEFENGEAQAKWTTYKERGRKLEPPRKQQATLKEPPPGPLVLDSTIQVVGPLLLSEDGERRFVRARFDNEAREGEPLVEYEAGCRLRRTSRPEGAGFTIMVFEPESDEPEMTWKYDSKGNCQSIQLSRTTVMKPHEGEASRTDGANTDSGGRLRLPVDLRKALVESGQSLAEFEKNLYATISQAAGIPNNQWEKFATDPRASTDGIEGKPLSLVLMSLNPPKESKDNPDILKDFHLLTLSLPKPTELHKAMAPSQPHGYVSAIQPDYIKDANVHVAPATGLLGGSVAFEAPGLYAGKVNFAMELKHGRMQVVEFTLPNYGITIARDEKGLWQRGVAADPDSASEEGVRNETENVDLDDAEGPDESRPSAERKTTAFLIESTRQGDVAAVKAALNAGVKPNVPANPLAAKQLTALHWAVAQRISDDGKTLEPSAEIAKLLIEAGADVNAADYLGQTPLEWAAKFASPEIVEMLIKAGASVKAESRYGTVLVAASNSEIAKLLIEAGADVNAGQVTKPLPYAAQHGELEIVRLLIDKGAAVDDAKNPPLYWAGKPEVAKALLEAGADVNLRNSKGETVLHFPNGPWFGPNPETITLLIEAGAGVNAKTKTESTPLHAAVQHAKPDIVKVLIAAGAHVDVKDQEGNTPLSLAHGNVAWARSAPNVESKTYEATVQLLVDAGAKDDGRTKLQQAVAAGDLEQVEKLIAAKADVNETGPQRISAVHLASEKGHAEILAALIEAGAKVDAADAQGMRPLHLAANAETARLLIAKGAKVNTGSPSPLYMATMNGKADVVRELLRDDANAKDSDCTTMLNWATFAGQIEVVNVLFELRDAKTLLAVKSTYSPLHVAASGSFGDMGSSASAQQRLDIAKLLVENGADVNGRWGANVDPKSGAAHMINTTPLMFASQRGEADMVKFMLDQKADPKATNASGQTALHFAAQYGHRLVVELLLKADADVNALTREAQTPLDLAGDAVVKILLIQKDGKTASEVLKASQR